MTAWGMPGTPDHHTRSFTSFSRDRSVKRMYCLARGFHFCGVRGLGSVR